MSICSTLISFHGVLVQSSILDCCRNSTKQPSCFYENVRPRSSDGSRNVYGTKKYHWKPLWFVICTFTKMTMSQTALTSMMSERHWRSCLYSGKLTSKRSAVSCSFFMSASITATAWLDWKDASVKSVSKIWPLRRWLKKRTNFQHCSPYQVVYMAL